MKRAWLVLALLLAGMISTSTSARAEEQPVKVTVGVFLNHISGIDLKNGQFVVDFYIWFRWEGDTLKPIDTFELANGRVTSKSGFVKKKLGRENYSLCRVVATMNNVWDLRRWPLDSHYLSLAIEDGEMDERYLVYVRDTDNTGISPSIELPGWVFDKFTADVEHHVYHTNYGDISLPSNTESTYSRYIFTTKVIRPGYGRFLKVFFGLFISVMISWCSFFVRPKESSPRVSLGVGATFAAAAVTVAINNTLPDTNAVTLADKLMMLTLGIIVAAVIETITALTLFAHGHEEAQKKLDRICSFVFPSVYIAILIAIVV